MIESGALITNGYGAVFKITERDAHADKEGLGYSGFYAVVIDGGKSGGEGKTVYLDDRDFGPDGLRRVTE